MIRFVQGNLLDSGAQALVNTVNTVGVMGKGIALMFKEAFPDNFRAYAKACDDGAVRVGQMFVTERASLVGPRWIINFPTKQHWRHPSKIEWVQAGLADLRQVLMARGIQSVAVPPLGSGNGGLDWGAVRPLIEQALGDMDGVEVVVYEPTKTYQNVMKRAGVETLTPARALLAELVRLYGILGFECTLLEVQKLAYFLDRNIAASGADDVLKLPFQPSKYGPFAHQLTHMLDKLDGSYLHCGRRLTDASPFDVIWFENGQEDRIAAYLRSAGKAWLPALEATARLIDGFESPLGMELLATVDWLARHERAALTVAAIRDALARWPGGEEAAARKMRLFDDRLLNIAIERLSQENPAARALS